MLYPFRRHIAECHIKRTHPPTQKKKKEKRRAISGPTYKLFSRFEEDCNNFAPLITGGYKILNCDNQDPFIVSQTNEVKEWAENWFKKGVLPREDYKELCELIVIRRWCRYHRYASIDKSWYVLNCFRSHTIIPVHHFPIFPFKANKTLHSFNLLVDYLTQACWASIIWGLSSSFYKKKRERIFCSINWKSLFNV